MTPKKTFQAKIDYLINDANMKMSIAKRNEIGALVSYTQALDLFDFLDKSDPIQLHELNAKISFCWEILGNARASLDYLTKALNIIPNTPTLILFKSVLLQSLEQTEESQKILLKYKQLGGNNYYHNFYYDTFRLIFYYVLEYEEDIILREINDYFTKYKDSANKTVVIYFIRAKIFEKFKEKFRKDENRYQHFEAKRIENLSKAEHIQPSDINYLNSEGISNENITKIFLMVLPHVIDFKPKPLIEYRRLFCGMGVFFLVFRTIKLFKIKLQRRKIKQFYQNQIKFYQRNNSSLTNNNSSFSETKVNTTDGGSLITKDMLCGNNKAVYKNIDEIKKEYQISVRNLYKSVWVCNMIKKNPFSTYDPDAPENQKHTKEELYKNYFVKNCFYSPGNVNPMIIKYIAQNEKYKQAENQKNSKIAIKISKPSNNIKEVKQKNKTPIKLSRSIRMKIQHAMSNHNRNNNSNSRDISTKSGQIYNNNTTKKNISCEDSSTISNDLIKDRNYTQLTIGKLSTNLNYKRTYYSFKTNVKEKKEGPRFTNLRNINIRLATGSKSKSKSKDKKKSVDKINTHNTFICNKIISSYVSKPMINQHRQKSSFNKYLINSFSNKSNNIKQSFKSSNSINKSDDSRGVQSSKNLVKNYSTHNKLTKTCENL